MATSVKKRVGTNLTEGSIMKGLIIFAIPIILTNIIQQLYSLVDLVVIGQFVGNIGTVGVNTGGEMADMVSPVAMVFQQLVRYISLNCLVLSKMKRLRKLLVFY